MGRLLGLSPEAVLIHAVKKITARIGGTNRARESERGDENIMSTGLKAYTNEWQKKRTRFLSLLDVLNEVSL